MYNVPEDTIYLPHAPWEQLPDDICPICGSSEWSEESLECLVCGGDKYWDI